MADLTGNSDRILTDARAVRDDNRAGGRHRAVAIGEGSGALRMKHWRDKLVRLVLAVFGILVAAGVAGLVLGGLGFAGVMATLLALVVAVAVLATFPRMKPPRRADLNKGDARQMVARTELWLEHQRPALPPPAARIVDDMGVQLDALGAQLETVPADHDAVREVRRLVGETLPEVVDSYRRIPANLRREERAGATPDAQVTESLTKISRELDHVTRQLAEGSLDDLAIKSRYLDYRYGGEAALEAPKDQA